ncbi:MAG TPA: glycosyltransferase, partial [Dehalococcoidia bacterium]|nr:glycosyltransferase [Dehalococcoidia bacterium]
GTQLLEENGEIQLSARAFPGYSTALFNRHSMLTRLLPGNRFSRRYLLSSWAHDETRDVDWVSGACMVLARRGIESFGAFDPAYFMYIEDVDLCLRAKKAGFRVVYFPAVRVRHTIGGSSRSATFRMIRARHASMARYYRKHLRRGFVFDSLTVGGIWARCGLQFALAAVRRVAGRPHRP